MPPKYIHGVHDVNGAYLMGSRPGWICITEAIGSDPYDDSGKNYTNLTSQGFNVIVRLNNGYRPAGTIPHSNEYDEFAMRCANFIVNSSGIHTAIIGNEPNHENERPNGEIILPTQYAKCFNFCYEEIKNVNLDINICVAAVAPWDATTKYSGNENGDWIKYHTDIYNSIFKADTVCIHTYTHGTDPNLIYSVDKMDYPFTDYFYNFLAYRDFLANTPPPFDKLPVLITETDQVVPWRNENTGWVKNAYREIDFWNKTVEHPKIHCLCLYRSNTDDQWSFTDLTGVHEDFRGAVAMGYTVNSDDQPNPTPPDPTPPDPKPEPPRPAPAPIVWDDRLNERGIVLKQSIANVGEWEWGVTVGKWYDEAQAQGRINAFFTVKDEHGNLVSGVPVQWYWSSGADNSKRTEIKNDPWLGHPYSIDFGMSSVAPSYGFFIADGVPSEDIWGMGLGDLSRPDWKIHTAYEFEFRKRRKAGSIDPIPPDPTPPDPPVPPRPTPDIRLTHPLPGSVITQHFYQNPQNYERFGMPGHNGTDFGGKAANTPILAVADGIVVYSERDIDYGWYVRIEHRDGRNSFSSMYCHLSEKGLAAGTQVAAGQQIGKLGTTGNSTGVHLHFEIRLINQDGQYRQGTPMPKGRVDPETFCIERGLNL